MKIYIDGKLTSYTCLDDVGLEDDVWTFVVVVEGSGKQVIPSVGE